MARLKDGVIEEAGRRRCHVAAQRSELHRPTGPVLERVRMLLAADDVAVVRFAPGPVLEVIAVSSGSFVGAGARLPLQTSGLAEAASAGRVVVADLAHGAGPLEAVAHASGIGTATALPLRRGDAASVEGALVVGWRSAPGSPERAARTVEHEIPGILALLERPEATPTLVVAHEDPIVAHGLAGLAFERLGAKIHVCATLADLMATVHRDDVVAVACDERLGEQPLAEIALALRAAGSSASLICVSETRTPASVTAALRAGVAGYLSPLDEVGVVLDVLATVLNGRMLLPPAPEAQPAPTLTIREQDVLRGLDRGLSDYEIARELGVSVSTAKTHARRLFRKLGVGSRTAAVHRARSEGLLRG